MKRFFMMITLAIIALCTLSAGIAHAKPTAWRAQHSRWANARYCPQHWRTEYGNTLLAQCEANLFGASWSRVRCIGMRESHFNYAERNPNSTASGTFQFLRSSWNGYYPSYRIKGLHTSVFNGRSNDIVAIKMMSRGVWSPWNSSRNPC